MGMNDAQNRMLRKQCDAMPNELLLRGIALFNAGDYFEQHEVLEEAWRQESGPIRQLYQGILQVGVAYLHIKRGNYLGATRLLERALDKLLQLPDVCQGVDVAQLVSDASTARAQVIRLGPERINQFSSVFFKPVRLKHGLR